MVIFSFFLNRSKEFPVANTVTALIKPRVFQSCATKQQDCVSSYVAQPLTWSLIGFQACLREWFSMTEPQT